MFHVVKGRALLTNGGVCVIGVLENPFGPKGSILWGERWGKVNQTLLSLGLEPVLGSLQASFAQLQGLPFNLVRYGGLQELVLPT